MQLTFSPKPLSHPGKHCSTYYETKQYNYVTGDCLLILLSCFFPLLSSSQNIGPIALLLFKNSLTVHGNIFAYTCWPDTFYRFFILVCFAPNLFCMVVFSSLPPIHYGDRTAVDNWRLSPKGGSRWSAALWRKRKGWQQMVHWQCSTVQKRQVSNWFPGVSWATITQRRFQLILPSLLQLIRFIH